MFVYLQGRMLRLVRRTSVFVVQRPVRARLSRTPQMYVIPSSTNSSLILGYLHSQLRDTGTRNDRKG